jgi:hypothetical protein
MTDKVQTDLPDKTDGAYFPILRGMELHRGQQRMLTALLRQPGLVPTVLTTGIRPEHFPEEWRNAFVVATKEPGRGKEIVADPNGDLTIRHLYMQVALLGDGQARQLARQIVSSVRRAQRQGDDHPTNASLTKSADKPARHRNDVADGDDINLDDKSEPGNHGSQHAGAKGTCASQDAKARNHQTHAEQDSPERSTRDGTIAPDLAEKIADASYPDHTRGQNSDIKRTSTARRANCHDWDDPDFSILDDRRGELPDFPLDALPMACREWVERAAQGAAVTPAHVAVPMLGIVSSIIGTARRLKASSSWSQPMTLWAAIVGFSGTGKTPGIDATKRGLSQVERDLKPKIAEQRRAHESRVASAKAARKKWEKELKRTAEPKVVSLEKYRSTVEKEPVMPLEAVDPGPFVAPRLCVSNTTIERLAVLLQARPQGMLVLCDELAALFLNMGRYNHGQDNEFWLEAWNGGSYTVERMNRPPTAVNYLLVGVVGGLQPDKLARSFKGDLDGMYARVLFAWPPEPEYRRLTNDVAEIEPEIYNALNRIVGLDGGNDANGGFAPRFISLSPEATENFEQFRHFAHQERAGLDAREREWWAKSPAHVLRLAGTLVYLDWAMRGGEEPSLVDDAFMKSAVRLVRDYFWPHTRAALRQIGLSERHANARRALRWIRKNNKVDVSREDIRRDALGQSLDADQTQELIDGLVKAGWLRQVTTKTPGRARHRWTVNPKLFLNGTAGSAESAERV